MLLGGTIVTAGATIVGNGNLLAAVAPAVALVALYAMWKAPLRYPLFALIFISLAFDVAGDGPWDSPVAPIGRLLAWNLDKTVKIPLPIPGSIGLLLLLVAIHAHRALTGSRIDAAGRAETPSPVRGAYLVSAAVAGFLCIQGSMGGGNMSMAKLQVSAFLLMLLLAYVSGVAFRGMRDYRTVATLVVAAACIKALIATYVMQTVVPTPEYATSHGDSVLFAAAAVILVVRYAEQPTRRNFVWGTMLMPLVLLGMVENDRRLVWVQVAAALITFWLVSERTRAKRYFSRMLLIAGIPVFALYVVVGWNSKSALFAPIQTYRSVNGDETQTDSSTLYRDTENYNLMMTMRFSPFMGSGFGRPFTEFVKLPDISFFKEYTFLPHNSLLGLWAFAGAFGFTGLSMTFAVCIYFARRAYLHARTPEERIAAFMVIGAVVVHLVQCWGDIGFSERLGSYVVGPALGMAGQLAATTGAWNVISGKTAAARLMRAA
jgi:O-antigen ligase